MAIWLLMLSCALAVTAARIATPRFPSSIVKPEQKLLDAAKASDLYTEKFFTQVLDHFNYHPQCYHTFQQRYLINDKHWGGPKRKSPIFVYTGNEGDIEWFAQNTGFMFETAPYFKALIVFIEVSGNSSQLLFP